MLVSAAAANFVLGVGLAFSAESPGLSSEYPGDDGIERDPLVLFSDNFESGDMKKWDQLRQSVVVTGEEPHAGH